MYHHEAENLLKRFESARTIPGTQKLHSFCPLSMDTVEVRPFSAFREGRVERVSSVKECVTFSSIKGYVVAVYDGNWWLACVEECMPSTGEVKLNFLHPHGPSPSFTFPFRPDRLVMDHQDVLLVVEPVTATGRTYTLSTKDTAAASNALVEYKMRV